MSFNSSIFSPFYPVAGTGTPGDIDIGGGLSEQWSSEIVFWPRFFAKFIAVCYAILCVMSAIQLLRTICYQHKIMSFRFGFLLVCFIWTSLRMVFWFFVRLSEWPIWVSTTIYFLPGACQVATFSLLILFYAKLVHRHHWKGLKTFFTTFCIFSNLVMIVLTFMFCGLLHRMHPISGESQQGAADSDERIQAAAVLTKLYYVCSSLFFGTLSLMAVYYIRKLSKVRALQQGSSREELLVTSLAFMIFLTRCVFDFMASFDSMGQYFRHQIVENPLDHVKQMEGSTFFLVFLWEICPTLMVITYFHHIPPTQVPLFMTWKCLAASSSSSTPTTTALSSSNRTAPSSRRATPQRSNSASGAGSGGGAGLGAALALGSSASGTAAATAAGSDWVQQQPLSATSQSSSSSNLGVRSLSGSENDYTEFRPGRLVRCLAACFCCPLPTKTSPVSEQSKGHWSGGRSGGGDGYGYADLDNDDELFKPRPVFAGPYYGSSSNSSALGYHPGAAHSSALVHPPMANLNWHLGGVGVGHDPNAAGPNGSGGGLLRSASDQLTLGRNAHFGYGYGYGYGYAGAPPPPSHQQLLTQNYQSGWPVDISSMRNPNSSVYTDPGIYDSEGWKRNSHQSLTSFDSSTSQHS